FMNNGRLTKLFDSGQMTEDLQLPPLDPENDRVMLCGSMAMLKDFRQILDRRGFKGSPSIGQAGDYVFERAFVG
ncbi:MAG: ferredoxin--NADP reductase, partial [Xanthomonadales bacterium]|nr:ferredoxin--NADP reductase [Xanthomonadales bacterium]